MNTAKIARILGLTEHGLRHLARAAANPDGRASGDGFGVASGAIRTRLLRDGLVEDREIPRTGEKFHDYPGGAGSYSMAFITETGRAIVKRAREMGY